MLPMSDGESPGEGREYGEPPGVGIIDWVIFALCMGFPWFWEPHIGTVIALGCLFSWFFFVRPTWRGLLPTFLTGALVANVVARLVHMLVWAGQQWSPLG